MYEINPIEYKRNSRNIPSPDPPPPKKKIKPTNSNHCQMSVNLNLYYHKSHDKNVFCRALTHMLLLFIKKRPFYLLKTVKYILMSEVQ